MSHSMLVNFNRANLFTSLVIIFQTERFDRSVCACLCVFQSGLVLNGIEDGYQYMCNTRLERFTNVVGTQPIERSPVIEFQGERLTAVKVTVVHDHTVVLAGTSSGRLKKVCFLSFWFGYLSDISCANEYKFVISFS